MKSVSFVLSWNRARLDRDKVDVFWIAVGLENKMCGKLSPRNAGYFRWNRYPIPRTVSMRCSYSPIFLLIERT